jgi:hypothetical protein
MTDRGHALQLANHIENAYSDVVVLDKRNDIAAELRRLHEEVALLRGDPGNRYAHRLAIELECALLAPEQANVDLLDEYHTAVREWMEANGQPYVSGFGKD